MKKIYLSLLATCLMLSLSTHASAQSSGAIQLVNFPSQFSENAGYDFSIPIDFIYSGSYPNQLGVSVVGSNSAGSLPPGVTLGAINYGTNGIDSITLSGNSSDAGSYYLSLVITDNNGALLTEPFTFSISANDYSLPDAIVNHPYSQTIPLGYNNETDVVVQFSAWQNNLQTEDVEITSYRSTLYNGSVTLQLTPYKTGQFMIEADIYVGNTMVNSEMFKLTVNDSATVTPAPAPIVVTPPVVNQQSQTQTVASNPAPVQKVIMKQPTQPVTAVQNSATTQSSVTAQTTTQTQIQATANLPTTTPAKPKSGNIFSSVWNFLKHIF